MSRWAENLIVAGVVTLLAILLVIFVNVVVAAVGVAIIGIPLVLYLSHVFAKLERKRATMKDTSDRQEA